MKTQTTISKAPTWDLESVFPGGSDSDEFAEFRKELKQDLKAATGEIKTLPSELNEKTRSQWIDFIMKLQDLLRRLEHSAAFSECLICQNVKDEKAQSIQAEIDVLISEYKKLMVLFEAFAKKQKDGEWSAFTASDELAGIKFYLNETRDIAKKKMAPEFEALAADLAVNGYHAWNRLYDKIYGDLTVELEEKGQTRKLSLGQLANRMNSSDRGLRRRAFDKLEEAWETVANQASLALNFQGGFRLTLYERRGWDSPLIEPLMRNRIKRETLEAMWRSVEAARPKLSQYVQAKKKLLGFDAFKWYDQAAPVGNIHKTYAFDEAGNFIIDKLGQFSPDQSDFTKMALDKRWVEAEDRADKAGGAFCTGLEHIGQTRVFMTFGGSFDNLSTLAHELGHAYHHWIIKDLPAFASQYPMTLAETASIFNELLVTDAALERAEKPDERLMLLDQKLQNALILFCNIYARYLFDTTFYGERKAGLVSRTRLDEIMVAAQKKAFGEILEPDGYHPLFWASKLHFFITSTPFYNFPYTFGYLFATGVYNRAREEGASFAAKYQALLADTGKMTAEELARKHLDVDLSGSEFWDEAVRRALDDVDPFVKLAGKAG